MLKGLLKKEKLTVRNVLLMVFAGCVIAFVWLVSVPATQGVREGLEISKLAQAGDVEAQAKLGEIYLHGRGGPMDLEKAAKWLTLAAEQGNSRAKGQLAYMYYTTESVRDATKASGWALKGALEKDPLSQAVLGRMYYFGDGVAKNPKEAERWLKLSAGQGNTYAMSFLGGMYFRGVPGVIQKDNGKAYKWLKQAADAGEPSAAIILKDLEKETPSGK
jgi:hypothetical protein